MKRVLLYQLLVVFFAIAIHGMFVLCHLHGALEKVVMSVVFICLCLISFLMFVTDFAAVIITAIITVISILIQGVLPAFFQIPVGVSSLVLIIAVAVIFAKERRLNQWRVVLTSVLEAFVIYGIIQT